MQKLGETTVLACEMFTSGFRPWLKKCHMLKVSIELVVNLCIVLIISKGLYEIVKICLHLLLSECVRRGNRTIAY